MPLAPCKPNLSSTRKSRLKTRTRERPGPIFIDIFVSSSNSYRFRNLKSGDQKVVRLSLFPRSGLCHISSWESAKPVLDHIYAKTRFSLWPTMNSAAWKCDFAEGAFLGKRFLRKPPFDRLTMNTGPEEPSQSVLSPKPLGMKGEVALSTCYNSHSAWIGGML